MSSSGDRQAAGGAPAGPKPRRARLIRGLPEVFLGADALAGLDGRRGFLFGEKRHRQVDVLGFDPWERGPGAPISLDSLVGGRLDRAAVGGWRIVGLAITPEDLRDGTPLLLDGLVTGDVVIAGPGAKTVLVHCGDRFADAGSGRRGIARPV